MEILSAWLAFAICVLLIGMAGPALTRSGGDIAARTGMSASWVGLIMLAAATSLPELFTGISAVTIADAPNIAMGDALGSCIFNLVMLVLLDALCRDEPFWRRSDQGHILSAGFGVVLISFVGALMLTSRNGLDFRIGHVSVYSPLLIMLYFIAMRAAFFYERRPERPAQPLGPTPGDRTLKRAVVNYLVAAGVVGAAGAWLPFVGQEVAAVMGWRASFVGTLFIAAATSIPELIVTVSALRMGSADMAIGNLLGSNLFIILVIALDDIVYTDGSFYAQVSPAHAVTAFAAAMMSGLCIIGLLYRPGNRFFGLFGWISLSLLAIYLLSSYAIYLHGH
ncbi:sodium:calcium antiporter [Novosphingobium sp. KN65.2]|uniref:sodium:calcium antiporter n=1 Tax=Novosphingobium sp. KN65.2 TaxID=1478134 RepID=UPI0005E9ECFC|nr:cation transporter [Novosphingobium sp. KN65.2]CDO35121.1 Sodium/calcium exchanger membrane region [Novosphingobium sp. KN65.2]